MPLALYYARVSTHVARENAVMDHERERLMMSLVVSHIDLAPTIQQTRSLLTWLPAVLILRTLAEPSII